jgi:hypothetical protein
MVGCVEGSRDAVWEPEADTPPGAVHKKALLGVEQMGGRGGAEIRSGGGGLMETFPVPVGNSG